MFTFRPPRSTALLISAFLTGGVLTLTACSSDQAPATGGTTDAASSDYPVTIDNCGTDVTFDEEPQRVMLLESAPVTILDGVGVFDRVISKAGSYPDAYYDDDLARRVDKVPALTDDLDLAGHLQISQEEIIAQDPDLVLGLPDGVSREALKDAGINVLIQEMYCPNTATDASFETLYDEIDRYGTVFDQQAQADDLVDDLKTRVSAVEKARSGDEDLTAAVLYPTVGGGTMYAYGQGSMAEPQLESLGLENVFADQSDRVFEVQPEKIIAADPDVIVLLYQGSKSGIEETVTSLPGADDLSAVKNDRVFTQLFNFTEPASPLTVTGLEHLSDALDDAGAQ